MSPTGEQEILSGYTTGALTEKREPRRKDFGAKLEITYLKADNTRSERLVEPVAAGRKSYKDKAFTGMPAYRAARRAPGRTGVPSGPHTGTAKTPGFLRCPRNRVP